MNFGCFFCLVCRLQCDVLARPEEGRRREAEKEGRKEGNGVYIWNYVYRSIGVIHLIRIRQCGSSESGSR